jgi:hypothetical protein
MELVRAWWFDVAEQGCWFNEEMLRSVYELVASTAEE